VGVKRTTDGQLSWSTLLTFGECLMNFLVDRVENKTRLEEKIPRPSERNRSKTKWSDINKGGETNKIVLCG